MSLALRLKPLSAARTWRSAIPQLLAKCDLLLGRLSKRRQAESDKPQTLSSPPKTRWNAKKRRTSKAPSASAVIGKDVDMIMPGDPLCLK